MGIKVLPSLAFLIVARHRYRKIKSIGRAKTSYSLFYKIKQTSSYSLAMIYSMLIVLAIGMPPKLYEEYWDRNVNSRFFNLIYLINVFAWIVSGVLLRSEYRRRLSEAFYTH